MFFSVLPDSEKPLKEPPKPINNTLLLHLSVPSAKPRHRRHNFVDIRSRGLDLTVSERIVNKLARFHILEIFRLGQRQSNA